MTAAAPVADRPLTERALEALKRSGNPFRNYFARNPDDEVCARYHVPELFAAERDLLLGVVDLYRYDPMTHSEVVPVLGNKGAGKTHLLHSIKHGSEGAWQLLVTPGVYQKDTEFLEYLLFQIIDTLLGGGRQKGVRPLEYVGEELVRRLLASALRELNPADRTVLFPPSGMGKWARKLGLGAGQVQERLEWLLEALDGSPLARRPNLGVKRAAAEAGLDAGRTCELIAAYVERTEAHNTAGLMRRAISKGFARSVLLGEDAELAGFLTFGFAELDFRVRPSRQDLVLALFKVLMEVFRGLKTPVVVAFDQLEDLLLARRSDDAHRVAEAFFAGIVQAMHQIDGLCFLIFAERGLWNRFVPSLDGYIQDRLNNPVHVPRHGTVKALRLEAPTPELVRRVVEARLRPGLEELPDFGDLDSIFPFSDEQVMRIARTEPTLRDMLQQFRHLFDHVVYGSEGDDRGRPGERVTPRTERPSLAVADPPVEEEDALSPLPPEEPVAAAPAPFVPPPFAPAAPPPPTTFVSGSSGAEPLATNRLPADDTVAPVPREAEPAGRLPAEPPEVLIKSVVVVESPDTPKSPPAPPPKQVLTPPPAVPFPPPLPARRPTPASTITGLGELWEPEQRSARRRLEPEGALTGAARELQAGLGAFLQICHEHGVKVGPWRLQHVVGEYSFGEHPTYGAITIAHWACKDGQPWKVGIGLFLGRGAGKPKDLEVKLSVMDSAPAVIDHLILLRPEDDLALSGKSKTLWLEAEKRGHHARVEPVSLDGFAILASFPRWLASVTEALPDGQPLPNLADVIQEKCEKLLEQVCMPIQQ
jgi:hypothetical protein